MKRISFYSPAKMFSEALPIGNGRLGAMIYGGISRENIGLNHDSIWYGGPMDRVNPDAKENLQMVRELILEGRIPEAEELMTYAFSGTPQSQRPYQPLGDIEISYTGIEGDVEDYVRELDLETAIVTERYKYQGLETEVFVKKSCFASYPDGILVVHIESQGAPISMKAILRRGRFYENAGKLDENTIYMDGQTGDGGVAFFTAVRADVQGGTVKTVGEHLLICDAQEITLYVCAESSFYYEDYVAEAKRKLDAGFLKGYYELKETHIRDYQSLYQRVEFEISGTDKDDAETYFQFGRYLLISSSRPGSLPANLQGIWNDKMMPPWDSKYTININAQMNYWPAEICNLSECHQPLFEHLKRMWPRGQKVAKDMYGCRGFVAHHNTDIWGDCAPQDIYIPATYWVMGAAWLCTHIWTHYLYTGDKVFLQNMYEIFKDAVLFFHDYLIEMDGELVTCPSVSPENTYIQENGVRGCICVGSSMDNQILTEFFENFLKASEVLGIADDIVEKTHGMLEKLPKIKIGKHGQIMEWMKDYEEADPGHRHISHLFALHPAHQITPDKTPDLAKAAAKTLERRLEHGGGHTGWSCAWIVNFYARLGDGESAWKNLHKLWAESTFPNRMDSHPMSGGAVFQIDGNFGATAAIAEMIVQTDEERVLLLPALPKEWKSGHMNGLLVPQGATVDVAWQDNTLLHCTIHAKKPIDILFCYQGEKERVILKEEESVVLHY